MRSAGESGNELMRTTELCDVQKWHSMTLTSSIHMSDRSALTELATDANTSMSQFTRRKALQFGLFGCAATILQGCGGSSESVPPIAEDNQLATALEREVKREKARARALPLHPSPLRPLHPSPLRPLHRARSGPAPEPAPALHPSPLRRHHRGALTHPHISKPAAVQPMISRRHFRWVWCEVAISRSARRVRHCRGMTLSPAESCPLAPRRPCRLAALSSRTRNRSADWSVNYATGAASSARLKRALRSAAQLRKAVRHGRTRGLVCPRRRLCKLEIESQPEHGSGLTPRCEMRCCHPQ